MLCINLIQKQVIIDFNLRQLILRAVSAAYGAKRSSAQPERPRYKGRGTRWSLIK